MKILKEPFFHFLGLGVFIFAAYAWLGDVDDAEQIVVTRGQQDNLVSTFKQSWQRPPTTEEFQGMLEDYIRQEIAYREASAMELDRNDIIIRRRLRQKLELLTEDLASMTPPTTEEIAAFYEMRKENYRADPRFSFQQLYFSADHSSEKAREEALGALVQLEAGGSEAEIAADVISLPRAMRDASRREVAATFGTGFADALAALPEESWAGPVESGFGLHLVRVADHTEARIIPLDEVWPVVRNDLLAERRQQAVKDLYDRLADNYRITVEPFAGDLVR